MIDSVKLSEIPVTKSVAEKQPTVSEVKKEESSGMRREPVDRVEISQEAQERMKAEKEAARTAAETRRMLEESRDSVGIDREQAEEL